MASLFATSPHWISPPRDPEKEKPLADALGIAPMVAALLIQRGYRDAETANAFLNPRLEDLHDPKLLPDFDKAVKEILHARDKKGLIYVHGDYDVDGVTSAALLSRFLTKIGCLVETHVPHRMKEGYGIHLQAVHEAKHLGARLFLTCDCGSSAHEQITQAKAFGMRVVVTDHHEIKELFPEADAFVNPHRSDSIYPYSELSGVGVAFKLCQGIAEEISLKKTDYQRAFLDLAALGTIADVMPLTGENRIIAKFGLEQVRNSRKPGIQALLTRSGILERLQKKQEPLRARDVGFTLGPRLNAAGRIDDASTALKLLLATEPGDAATLAEEVERRNQERRDTQQLMLDEALEMVAAGPEGVRNFIVVASDKWHPGVIGIVAGRIAEKFYRPTLVVAIDSQAGTAKGSARSIPTFNLAEAIWAHPELMQGGGHAAAAGCSFPADQLEAVSDALHHFAGLKLTPEDLIPRETVDVLVEVEELTVPAIQQLELLEPFGCGNQKPVFLARNLNVVSASKTSNGEHARFFLKGGESAIQGIGFNMGERSSELSTGSVIDVLFSPDVNEWNGNSSPQMKVRDYQLS